jgi:low temperature requirement protein LtrA
MPTMAQFRRWFWARPRAHGELIEGRRVSYVELLYDLVYVAIIAQSTIALGNNLTLDGFIDFVVVFGLVWIGWVNGSLYLELHGRDDGRTRTYVFIQMAILCLLAVFTQRAAGESGAQFALTYVAFLLVVAWLFFTVRRLDEARVRRVTGTYAIGLVIFALFIFASAFLPPEPRLMVWAAFDVLWIVATVYIVARPRAYSIGLTPTGSMTERLDTFTLIVLGEVVVGVVAGLSVATQDAITVITGIVALIIGLGFWWIYFDIVGGRPSRQSGANVTAWILSHLPITLAIAAAGAAMVSLVVHATEPVTPPATAWLLCGAVAAVLLGEVATVLTFPDAGAAGVRNRLLLGGLTVGAVAALAIGFIPLPPWALAVALNVVLLVTWGIAVSRSIGEGTWPPGSDPAATA